MSLAEHLDEVLAPPSFVCKYVRSVEAAREAEPEDVDRLLQAVESGALSPALAASALSRAGYKVSSDTAQRHARGACGCDA